MCDARHDSGTGWRGWIALPPMAPAQGHGSWTDLSHVLGPDMPRQPFFPAPSFGQIRSLPGFPLNVSHIDMVAHLGTHVDSPRHAFNDGPAFEDIPLDRLHGAGLVWKVQADARQEIGPDELEPASTLLERGDILILNTGMHRLASTDAYLNHPSLSMTGAQWVIDHEIKLLAIDTPTPDAAHHRRGPDFDFPVHKLLLGHGVLIAEHLTNLDTLSGCRVEILCHALNIAGGDGSPARILARPLESTP